MIISENKSNRIPFLIALSYLVSLLFIRISALIAGSANSEIAQVVKQNPKEIDFYIGRNIILFGYHIHHFYFGILFIAIAGWLALVRSSVSKERLALLYGAGLGLLMDEIGLLLTWGNYYSSLTYLLSIILLGIFLNIIYFPYFWRSVRKDIVSTEPHRVTWDSLLNYNTFIKVADKVSEKTDKTESFSLTFTGITYLVVGFLIIMYPKFVYYWVAGVFFVQGISSLVRAWKSREKEER
ncbi:MAG: hypothetical protein ACOC4G_03020 [Bacillota bacterium]